MCPACWGMMAVIAAGVASTGALGVAAARVVQAGKAAPNTNLERQIGSEERRSYDEHGN
jgi:hypothetical protein